MTEDWLALIVGNSRLHWAWWADKTLHQTWDTPHLQAEKVGLLIESQFNFKDYEIPRSAVMPVWKTLPDLWISSVAVEQAQLWEVYPRVRTITLAQVPLKNTYPTLGVDRALAVWGAIATYGAPILVIDGGTALTFTGADESRSFVGGAILPGLQLQFRMLGQATSALPVIETGMMTLPDRWAMDTISAMQSGILYTVLSGVRSFVEDWQQRFPNSVVVFTGGDGMLLHRYFQQQSPEFASQISVDPNLLFWGMCSIKNLLGA
ncbi:pantothenate kinase [Phormidesmis priestleyi ULC007]|uniref:Type III pantothenate kinase n=1 Tax=Phormidesmis priestleyi ULC007 TaxID=1920490 RepID=A0A2T1DJP8_9CYAN|nr:pantothenate kinase [Phormidesmis priestleyi]PSB20685.1 pantothenate kinase [Phormidesmis priestleyi ULC007]PZO47108.1 MAG: pantothenate kinase [Phormidesmis priestleyi]